jgi:hypothetical protein
LKKQSQFFGGRNGVNLVLTMVYGNISDRAPGENKAKRSQYDGS